MFNYDGTVTLGNLLTIVSMLAAAVGMYTSFKSRLGSLEAKMDGMKDVMVNLARQDERLKFLDQRVDDLQHGRGFVLDANPPRMHMPHGS